jgi:hypothetical protein
MPRAKSHKDVEFAVDNYDGSEKIFKHFDQAVMFAVHKSLSGRSDVHVDVLIHSVAGARWWGGNDGVEEYRSDPDASVAQRIEIKAIDVGRVY